MRTPDEETMRSQLPHLQMGKLKDREGKSYSWDETLDTEPSLLFTSESHLFLFGSINLLLDLSFLFLVELCNNFFFFFLDGTVLPGENFSIF